MKKLFMWLVVLFFISCATITENQDDQNVQTTIQYDESNGGNGGGSDGGDRPPKPPPPPPPVTGT